MNKNIFISFISLILLVSVSCKDDTEDETEPFDHVAQWAIESQAFLEYFDTHYYDESYKEILPIPLDEDGVMETDEFYTPLNEDTGKCEDGSLDCEDDLKLYYKFDSIVNIGTEQEDNEVSDYKVYYYTVEVGKDNGNVGYSKPSSVDSVFIKYSGFLLDGTPFINNDDYPRWFYLNVQNDGWRRGLTRFSRGTFETIGNDFHYENTGKGYLFIPSGIGPYRFGLVESISGTTSSSLIYKIEMNDVNLIDEDLDGVPNKFEMTFDSSEDFSLTDWDGDGVTDELDKDDDNDHNYQDTEYTYTSTTLDEVEDEFEKDINGNYDFHYDSTGSVIVKKGSDGTDPENNRPNYKNDKLYIRDSI